MTTLMSTNNTYFWLNDVFVYSKNNIMLDFVLKDL